MKQMLWIGVLASLVSLGYAEDGWISLFDGETFSGWSFDTLDKAVPETIWEIRDGTIHVAGTDKPAGVIRTEKSYSNYTLEFEWRWPEGKGNSGCLIHCTEPRWLNVWPRSIEVQLMAGQAGDFWLIGETVTVKPEQIALDKKGMPGRRRLNLTDDSEKPLGEWNQMRIVTEGSRIEVFVNGTLVNRGWDASATEGAICLQAEKADIQFRNLRIRAAK